MIVYGDDPIRVSLGCFAEKIARRVDQWAAAPTVDDARAALVLCGQLEQAAWDGHRQSEAFRAPTSAAADLFLTIAQTCHPPTPACLDALGQSLRRAASLARPGERPATLKQPEGFAWYALYPEAYAQMANVWAEGRDARQWVRVIGVRGIGTTLAALIGASLRARGLSASDETARPTGHPFARECVLPPWSGPAGAALVADEGPGLSGSSMASAADCLVGQGFDRDAIVFFAGHEHGPGPSDSVRAWWTPGRVRATPWRSVRIGGRTMPERLAAHASATLGCDLAGPLAEARDHGFAMARLSLRADGASGLIYRFAGFSAARPKRDGPLLTRAEEAFARATRLAETGLVADARGAVDGWLALSVVEGLVLASRDLDSPTLQHLAKHIVAASEEPLDAVDARARLEHLHHMLLANAGELLGARAQAVLDRVFATVARLTDSVERRSYGDGGMWPSAWAPAPTGRLLKSDVLGPDGDHTVVGRQAVEWDIAGAIVEWDMDRQAGRALIERLCGRGIQVSAETLVYYVAAYAAFNAGLAHHKLGLGVATGAARTGLVRRLSRCRAHLARAVEELAAAEFKLQFGTLAR